MQYFKSKTIEGKIAERINKINCSFPQKETSPKFMIRFAAKETDTLYKHIPDYAQVKFGKKTKEEDYIVNACVWQEYLVREWLDKIDLTEIAPTERKSDIFQISRTTSILAKDSEKKKNEKRQCKALIDARNSTLGELVDFQVPLKARKKEMKTVHPEHKGELDLVACQGDTMVLIEYKIPDSPEPLLRAVLEAITYYYQIAGDYPQQNTYLTAFNDTFGRNCNKIGIAIVVPKIAYTYGHRRAYQLIKDYDITCYTFNGDENDFENIYKLTEEQIDDSCEKAKENLKEIYEHSDDIVAQIKLI